VSGAASPILQVQAVEAGYGRSQVLHGVSLEVAEGGVTALLGANGAGKTTTLRAISGMIRHRGLIKFGRRVVSGLRPDQIARLGLAHVPQGRGTLTRLTTEENLLVGALRRKDRAAVDADLRRCYDLFPRLAHRRQAVAGNLSGGEQQMLALGRALMSQPKLLVLDEPSLGLAPRVVSELYAAIQGLRVEWGLSMLIVEQNATVALSSADTAVVLEAGRVALSGPAAELAELDEVRRAYLGT
jgi:branched-chain amino acid transport system ATP-binding protein